jgi:hypothetical protein
LSFGDTGQGSPDSGHFPAATGVPEGGRTYRKESFDRTSRLTSAQPNWFWSTADAAASTEAGTWTMRVAMASARQEQQPRGPASRCGWTSGPDAAGLRAGRGWSRCPPTGNPEGQGAGAPCALWGPIPSPDQWPR